MLTRPATRAWCTPPSPARGRPGLGAPAGAGTSTSPCSTAGLLTYVAQGCFTTGAVPRPHGSAHPTIVPYQALRTGDGHLLMVAAGNDKLWRALAETIGCG
ncbi:CoA transferase [Streptomyces poonensis]|uniref:CoA transferase n=1 Tax=Streptomyces poonensis TaxID=68255 RepID=UPI001E4F887F|nr:CoA transferase [Streptomyces poonensis]